MTAMTSNVFRADPPSPRVSEIALQALNRLREHLRDHRDDDTSIHLTVTDQPGGDLELPREVIAPIARILSYFADGQAVTVLPTASELTTQQAADVLNVSRPFLIKLLDSGAIQYRMVGSHRRVQLRSLLDHKRVDDARTMRAANDLTALDEELGLV
jgi:excisionase family DNA binding protein